MSVVEAPDVTGIVTARGYINVASMPTVEGLTSALKALRAAGATEDVVGFAIPVEGHPSEGGIRPKGPINVRRRRFDIGGYLLDVIDPHRPVKATDNWARGRNGAIAKTVLGKLTRWLVGVHTFRVPLPEGSVWVIGRPNHASAIQGLRGDAQGGAAGALASVGVPVDLSAEFAERLAAGECIVTTCETDEGRWNRDRRILERAGA
ncbi:MAG TPA: hypothetical protein VGW38_11165, partial [Chloroflexota bacterium]|nr:hypothetical protein [Chloroflexota bacterium]